MAVFTNYLREYYVTVQANCVQTVRVARQKPMQEINVCVVFLTNDRCPSFKVLYQSLYSYVIIVFLLEDSIDDRGEEDRDEGGEGVTGAALGLSLGLGLGVAGLCKTRHILQCTYIVLTYII